MNTSYQPETHPLSPFVPPKAQLLMLGSFPPPKARWSIDFYYPNFQNDMWRIMAMCEETKKPFGITVDPREGSYAFIWAFKIKPEQAKREGYDKTHVRGAVMYDPEFNGSPHCGAKSFYICNRCGKVVCYHGQEYVTCPNCGNSSSLRPASSVDLSGGGF